MLLYALLPVLYHLQLGVNLRPAALQSAASGGPHLPPFPAASKEVPGTGERVSGIQEEKDSRQELALLKQRNTLRLYPKEVFLTFDDGPSPKNTPRILEILTRFKVKATFFTVGRSAEAQPELLWAEDNKGMSIASHSYTHNYRLVYASAVSFLEELQRTNDIINQVTGKEPLLFTRWPGGSNNAVSSTKVKLDIKQALRERGINYLDWNVDSGDARGITVPAGQIRDNVIRDLKGLNFAVVLMHDSAPKITTVEALPEIIQYLLDQGYSFRTLDELNLKEKEEMLKLGIMNK